MANGISLSSLPTLPHNFLTFPHFSMPSLLDEFRDETFLNTIPSGLSISEDEKNFFVEAALPGLEPKDIEVTFDKGILSIHGEKETTEEKRKFYRRSTATFGYQVAISGQVDPKNMPDVGYKNGMVKVSFKKTPSYKPKRIEVKAI